MANASSNSSEPSFTRKVWIAAGIVSLIVILLLLVKATVSVLLLILAAVLIAVFFQGLSGLIRRWTKWKEALCLAISITGTMFLICGLFWLMGAKLQSQIAELSETLPETIDNAKARLNESVIGQKVVERMSYDSSSKKVQQIAGTFFQSTFGVFGDIYVVLMLGIFFAVSPAVYKKGMVKLVPDKGKEKAEDVLDKLGNTLKKWLKGKIFAMFLVFVLTAAGLLIIGVPLWLVLAIIAGILNFIPNFGPLIALIPAVLVALMQSPTTALFVAGLYIIIQVVESNLITPMVQKKLISIPPALIIMAQLLIAPLTGGWGLVLATPVMVIILVLVEELYINRRPSS